MNFVSGCGKYLCEMPHCVYILCDLLYVLPRQTGRSRGFGFVYFDDAEDAADVSYSVV